jgi:hypothetical protein
MVIGRSDIITRSRPCHLPFMFAAAGLLGIVRFVRRFFLGAWL